ncbi:hypothetical protein [Kribbella amoyensis]|uniref:hypothetical protein n=1 Tax=Kribbella amoyensis TaxID=996641 RepID=UPI0011A85CFD|nr:hypothetical protein [Kribbella amoyensis]
MKELPPDEQATVAIDLPIVKAWIEQHPGARALVHVDRAPYESTMGHVLIVVTVPRRQDVRWIQDELTPLLERADRLRVRRFQRSLEDAERVQEWLHATQPEPGGARTGISWSYPDPESGRLLVALDRRDPIYAAELEAASGGVIEVRPDPEQVHPL